VSTPLYRWQVNRLLASAGVLYRLTTHPLAQPRRDPQNPRNPTVHEYVLPTDLVPIFDMALRRLKR
jgi:hypothetical protein